MGDAKVLLVGHCGFDSRRIIESLQKSGFDEFDSADSVKEAAEKCLAEQYSLVVANRVIEGDGRGGIKCVEVIKSDQETVGTPVLVLSAYTDTQEEAVEKGAERGFGKDLLDSDEAVDIFSNYL
ncbi:MAG: hypothetical protein ACYTFY_03410 [Planctomycetota bacterium]|jgi:CheY-like chemotaxis protein